MLLSSAQNSERRHDWDSKQAYFKGGDWKYKTWTTDTVSIIYQLPAVHLDSAPLFHICPSKPPRQVPSSASQAYCRDPSRICQTPTAVRLTNKIFPVCGCVSSHPTSVSKSEQVTLKPGFSALPFLTPERGHADPDLPGSVNKTDFVIEIAYNYFCWWVSVIVIYT